MHPRRLHTAAPSSAPRRTTRRGETTASLMLGLAIGALIIGAFAAFWMRSTHLEGTTEDLTKKESSGLNVLNRIKADVGDSAAVASAGDSEIVLDKVDDDGDITRVLYAMDDRGRIYTVTRRDAPDTYNPDNPGWGPASAREYLADDVRNAVDADGETPLFTYIAGAGSSVEVAANGYAETDELRSIKRIDIAFAAHAGEGRHGYVELRTSASLNTGAGGEVDPHLPACPLPYFTQGDPDAIIQWDVTGQTTSYRILRNGVVVDTRDYDDTVSEGVYRYTDGSVRGSSTPVDFQVLAVGPGGISGDDANNCPVIRWYPRVRTPVVTTSLMAAATESPAWVTSGYSTPTVRLSWAPVAFANGYEVYRRALDNEAPYSVTGTYTRVGLLTSASSTTFEDNLGSSGWDKAYEYQVVANGPMPEASVPTAGMKVLTHSEAPTRADAEPVTYNQNRITWTDDAGETATGYAVYRRDISGCFPIYSSWQKVAGPLPLGQTSWTDTTAPLSTRFEYAVGAYNLGPRGGTANLQYASLLSTSDQALQYPANPTTSASGSYTAPGGATRSALASGYTAYNVGISNVAWSSPCASTTETYRLDLYGTSRTSSYSSLDMGTQTSWKDPGWFGAATERNYKAVAYNATGSSPNADNSAGLVSAYQYSNRPGNGSVSSFRSTYDVYSGYTDDNVRPSSALGSCYSTVVDVDDSHWQGGWDQEWVPGYWEGGNAMRWVDGYWQGGYDRVWVEGYRDKKDVWHPGYWDQVWNPRKTWVSGYFEIYYNPHLVWHEGYYKDVWNPQKTWIPDSDGDLRDYRWYCTRYQGGYTVSWNEAADTGDASNPFCNYGRGSCSSSVYWTDTGRPMETTRTGAGSYSATYYWYTGLIYGHDYSYNVSQPEGVISCNAGGCAASTQPTVCSSNCSPGPITDDPPMPPSFRVLGSDRNNDTVPDSIGTNTVQWNPVPGATSYTVYRYTSYNGGAPGGTINTSSRTPIPVGTGSSCSDQSQGYKLCFYDGGRARGSETYYKVVSQNAKGTGEGATLEAGYQVAGANTLTNTLQATIDDDRVGWQWQKTVDGSMPAIAKFCASAQNSVRGRCSYMLEGYDVINGKVFKTWDLGADVDKAEVSQPPGKRFRYTLYSCNKGGCHATLNGLNVDTWPGEFRITKAPTTQNENRGNKWYASSVQENPREFEMVDIYWSNSRNAVRYAYGFEEQNGDPFDRKFPSGYNGNFGTAVNVGDIQDTTGRAAAARRVTPQARYVYTVWAVAENGKSRPATARVLAAPAKPLFGEVARFCKPGSAMNSQGWKTGYRIHTAGTSTDVGGTGATRDIVPDRVRWAWWTGLMDRDAYEAGDGAAGARGIAKINATRSLSPHNPENWRSTWTDDTAYYDSSFEAGGWIADNTIRSMTLGGDSDNRIVPWQYRAWTAFDTYAYSNPDSYAVDLGDGVGGGNSYHIGTVGSQLPCRASGGGWKWNGQAESMGRWADSAERTNGYFQVPQDAPGQGGFGVNR